MKPRPNKFPSRCSTCKKLVEAEKGFLCGKDEETDLWIVRCAGCHVGPEDAADSGYDFDHAYFENDFVIPDETPKQRATERDRDRWEVARERARKRREEQEEEIRRLIEAARERARRQREAAMPVPACLAIMGLRPPVTVESVKSRFRELARTAHPDRGGDAATFIKIHRAYSEALAMAAKA
jgi:hypothetical protein